MSFRRFGPTTSFRKNTGTYASLSGRRRQHQNRGNERRQLCAGILLAGSAPAIRQWHRTANWWFVVPPEPAYPASADFACVHIGSLNRYESFSGPGFTNDRGYLVIGNLGQVKEALGNLHLQFRALDPEVFDWREYVTRNGLQGMLAASSLRPLEAAEHHWLTQGITQGLVASKTFSTSQYLQLNPDVANAVGQTNYQGAIDHYINLGRGEGRGTVAKVTAGMQHLLVLARRSVTASGQNIYGQLGNGTLPATITEVAAGDYTSLAVNADGSLWAWGSNQYGVRGDGTTGENITDPVQVPIPNRLTTPSRTRQTCYRGWNFCIRCNRHRRPGVDVGSQLERTPGRWHNNLPLHSSASEKKCESR